MINVIALNLVKRRWLLMLFTLVVVGLMASGGRFIQFASDYEYWFSKDNPQLAAFLEIQNTYGKSDNVIFLITPKDGNVFSSSTLASVEWLTKQAWQIPYSSRVDSLTNYQHTYALGDELVVEDLVKKASALSSEKLERIKEIALNEPLLLNRAISVDGKVTAVNVTINLPKNTPEGTPAITAFSQNLMVQLKEQNPDLDLHLSGVIVMDNAFIKTSQSEGYLTLIMLFLVIGGLVVLLRSVTGTISTLIIIIFSAVATMGFSGWLGVKLTPVSANAPIIILTVTVAHAVHIIVSFLNFMRSGMAKQEAMVESLRTNLQPIFIATVTTGVGFLSMNFSDIPPFHDLGNMIAVGVLISFLTSVAFLPGLILLLPIRVSVSKEYENRYMHKLSNFVICFHKPLLWSLVGLTSILIVCISNNEVDEEVWKFFDETVTFRTDTDYASEHLSGPYFMEYSLKSNEVGGVSNPDFLRQVDSFKEWLYKQPEVVHVSTITDILKRLNKNMHGDDVAWYVLPDDKNLAAQYLLLYEMSLPYGLDLNNQINVDKSATRVTASLHNLSTKEMIVFELRVEEWLALRLPDVGLTAGSSQYMFSHIGQRTVPKMAVGISFAMMFISLLLMFVFRSFRIGVLSLVPNLAPPAIAFGIWGLLVGKVGFTHAVAIGMTIGIIVDDTVHFLSKYLLARREKGLCPEDAVRYAFSSVGVALIITTTVLVVGFMALTLSTFKLNVDLGAITALTIAIALILDFLLLPALLLVFDKNKDYQVAKDVEAVTESAS